jgi:hypothetical protein
MNKYMKKSILISLFFIISTFCKGEINTDGTVRKTITDSILVSSDNISLVLYGLCTENFDVKINTDTIFIVKKLYEGIDDLQIFFLSDDYNCSVLKGEIIYGANQYLIDDIGVVPLDFIFNDSVQINKTDGRYIIQSAIKENNIMEHFFEKTFFKEIKKNLMLCRKIFIKKKCLTKKKNMTVVPNI